LTIVDHHTEGGHAHKGCLFHEQPTLGNSQLTTLTAEKHVRNTFENDPNITFKQGMKLTGITENSKSVTITYQNESGTNHSSKVFPYRRADTRANSLSVQMEK
jgi:hypothetical protein